MVNDEVLTDVRQDRAIADNLNSQDVQRTFMGLGGALGAGGLTPGGGSGGGGGIQYVKLLGSTALLPIKCSTWRPCAGSNLPIGVPDSDYTVKHIRRGALIIRQASEMRTHREVCGQNHNDHP